MSDKSDSDVDEIPQLQVRGLERREVLGAIVCVEVAWFNPGEFSQVVHYLFLRWNVVVDKCSALLWPLTETLKEG